MLLLLLLLAVAPASVRADDAFPAVQDFLRPRGSAPAVPAPAAVAPQEELIDVCARKVMGKEAAPKPPEPPKPPPEPRLEKVPLPALADDLDGLSAAQAFEDTAAFWRRRPGQTVSAAGRAFTGADLAEAFESLARTLRADPGALKAKLEADFDAFQSMRKEDAGGYTGEGKVTGYYAPDIPVRSAPAADAVPVLAMPKAVPDDPAAPAGSPRKASRCQIYDGALDGQGLELYWARPSDLMALQTEGSGYGVLPGGKKAFLEYAGGNGRKWRGASGALLEVRACCMESSQDCGIPAKAMGGQQLQAFLKAQEPRRERLLTCLDPSYVFFTDEPGGRPKGALGVPLTAGRSVAVDRKQVPLGLPGLLSSSRPYSGSGFTRLVVTHDVGGAIQGGARVDLFWGDGPEAEAEGGRMNAPGRLYVLLPKKR